MKKLVKKLIIFFVPLLALTSCDKNENSVEPDYEQGKWKKKYSNYDQFLYLGSDGKYIKDEPNLAWNGQSVVRYQETGTYSKENGQIIFYIEDAKLEEPINSGNWTNQSHGSVEYQGIVFVNNRSLWFNNGDTYDRVFE